VSNLKKENETLRATIESNLQKYIEEKEQLNNKNIELQGDLKKVIDSEVNLKEK